MSQAGYFIGLISGTSMDAIDGVLVDLDCHPPRVLASHATPLPETLQLHQLSDTNPVGQVLQLDSRIADLFAATALTLLDKSGIDKGAVAAIGSHGQTVWHAPADKPAYTCQIGDPNRIAWLTGITTVADFRRMDMAAGGEGAPLVSAFHAAMLRRTDRERVILNLGGIANITVLPADPALPVIGFDTGPANTLLDAWTRRHLNSPFDRDGRWAATGRVMPELLERWLNDDYFSQPPPKSTGPEYFNLNRLGPTLPDAVDPADIQATLTGLTAASVAAAIGQCAPATTEVIACGGGVRNQTLMRALAEAVAPATLTTTADYGLDPGLIEALCFAWLARERLAGRAGNLPSVTGAAAPVVLGGIYDSGISR